MISNKRFSYAPASSSTTPFHSDVLPPPTNNGHLSHLLLPNHLASKQSMNFHHPTNENSNLLYRKAKDRNSLSLNHEFSHMYISKNTSNHHNIGSTKLSFGTAQNTKSFNRSLLGANNNNNNNNSVVDILPTLEEIQKHKRNALESKKQMSQMEKSISFWCDCTDYWRTKWKKTKEEKKKIMSDLNGLRAQVVQLEKQLKLSEEKRSKLSEKYHKIVADKSTSHSTTQKHAVFRKNLKLTRISQNINDHMALKQAFPIQNDAFDDDDDDADGPEYSKNFEINEIQVDNHVYGQIQTTQHTGSANRTGSTKVVLRNHDRLLDKKITNRKRFSQVVMCDADELLQMAQIENDLSSENTLQRNLPTNIPEEDPELEEYDYEHERNDNHRGRGFHYGEAEAAEDDCDGEEDDEGEDMSELNSSDLRNVSFKVRQHLLKGISGVSTLETNSECVNVGSINDDQSTAIDCDDDSTANEDDDDDDDDENDNGDNQHQISSKDADKSNPDKSPLNDESVKNKDKKHTSRHKFVRNDSRDGDADFEDDGDDDDDDNDDDDDDDQDNETGDHPKDDKMDYKVEITDKRNKSPKITKI